MLRQLLLLLALWFLALLFHFGAAFLLLFFKIFALLVLSGCVPVLSGRVALVELSCGFQSKSTALLFGGITVEGHLVLDQLDGGVDLAEVVGWEKLQFLELVDELNAVGKVFVLWLLLFLLLLWLLLGDLLIDVALLGGDDSGSAFDLFLPFLSENYGALGPFLLLVELEGIGPQALAVGYQVFA